MPVTVDQLLVAISRVAAKYPQATARWALDFPNMWITFKVGENIVAQLNIETGELRGDFQ
jgi:hypothetical protein